MGAATTLFLSDGVGVSTARIAKAAGVSNGTLFNVFPTKQALIDAIYATTKAEMFAALVNSGAAPFDRARLYENWNGYLGWARAAPARRKVMHLMLDAGLASEATKAEVEALSAPHAEWIETALATGVIRGPSVAYIGELILGQIDLVLSHELSDEQADLAFDMMCNAIGLSK